MRRRLFLPLFVFVALVAPLPAAAQKFIPKSIKFQGDPNYSTGELTPASGLKPGTILRIPCSNDRCSVCLLALKPAPTRSRTM